MTQGAMKRMQRIAAWGVGGLLLLVAVSAAVLYARWLYREQVYNALIEEVATRQGMGEDFKYLVKAVIRHESKFDAGSFGKAHEIGLMQVTEGAAQDWARLTGRSNVHHDQLWDPATNIEAGSWYLARALRRWEQADDPIPFALAEYNAGLGNVRRWLPPERLPSAEEFVSRITYPMVRDYIAKVRRYHEEYRRRQRL